MRATQIFSTKNLTSSLLISHPEIFNSDQGSQFTSGEFTEKPGESRD